MGDTDPIARLPKLKTSDDYILWKRKVYAYLRRDDAELIGFTEEPSGNTPAVRKKWFELVTKAKSIIVLCLGDSPLAKVRHLIDDDDMTAKQLRDEIKKIYTASNAQSILNLRQEIDDLRCNEGENWEEHVNKFMDLLSKLATYDEEISENDKGSKLLRTLPESFNGFAMIAQVQDLELQKIIQAMHAEIYLWKSIKGSSSKDIPPKVSTSDKFGKSSRQHGGKSGKIHKHSHNDDRCFVCGKCSHLLSTVGTVLMVTVAVVVVVEEAAELVAVVDVVVVVVVGTSIPSKDMADKAKASLKVNTGIITMVSFKAR